MPETDGRILISGDICAARATRTAHFERRQQIDGRALGAASSAWPIGIQGCDRRLSDLLELVGPVSAEWLVNGIWRGATLHPGDLCLATHGEFRSVAWRSPYDLLLLSISPQLMAEVGAHEGEVRPVELTPQRVFRDRNVETICRLLLADTAAGTPVGPIYGEHLACSVSVYLTRQLATRARNFISQEAACLVRF